MEEYAEFANRFTKHRTTRMRVPPSCSSSSSTLSEGRYGVDSGSRSTPFPVVGSSFSPYLPLSRPEISMSSSPESALPAFLLGVIIGEKRPIGKPSIYDFVRASCMRSGLRFSRLGERIGAKRPIANPSRLVFERPS